MLTLGGMFFDHSGHSFRYHGHRLWLARGCCFSACESLARTAFPTGVVGGSLRPSWCILSSNGSLHNVYICDGVRKLLTSISTYLWGTVMRDTLCHDHRRLRCGSPCLLRLLHPPDVAYLLTLLLLRLLLPLWFLRLRDLLHYSCMLSGQAFCVDAWWMDDGGQMVKSFDKRGRFEAWSMTNIRQRESNRWWMKQEGGRTPEHEVGWGLASSMVTPKPARVRGQVGRGGLCFDWPGRLGKMIKGETFRPLAKDIGRMADTSKE